MVVTARLVTRAEEFVGASQESNLAGAAALPSLTSLRRSRPAYQSRTPVTGLLDYDFAGHSEQPVQRLRAFQREGARLQRYQVDLFDFAGGDAEAAAALLRLRAGSPRPERDRAEEFQSGEGMAKPPRVLQPQRVRLAMPKYDPCGREVEFRQNNVVRLRARPIHFGRARLHSGRQATHLRARRARAESAEKRDAGDDGKAKTVHAMNLGAAARRRALRRIPAT